MATVVSTPVVPSQPRRMPRRLTISIVNDPPNFSSLAPLPTTVASTSSGSSSSSTSDDDARLSMAPPGLGGRRLSVTRTSAKINPYAAGGALSELSEVEEPTVSPTPAARPRLLSPSTSFFVQSPAPSPTRSSSPMKVNPYASGGALSEATPAPSKPAPVESKPMKPFNLRVLTTRQIQDMARAAQAAHNNQVQARMVAESILNRVRRRSQRRRFPRFGVIGFGQQAHSPLRKLAFDESDVSDDSSSSDGSSFGDWSSEDGSDEESLEEWERQLGDVSWFVDNGYD